MLTERTCGDVRRFYRSRQRIYAIRWKYQLTETQAWLRSFRYRRKNDTVTMMSYGFDPYLSSWSPYHGAVLCSDRVCCKIVATGGDYRKIRFTFQEYFRRMTEDPRDGASRLQHFSVLMQHRWDLDFHLSVVRTVCPVHSMILMYLRHWFLSQLTLRRSGYDHTGTKESRKQTGMASRTDRMQYDLPDYAGIMDQYGKFIKIFRTARLFLLMHLTDMVLQLQSARWHLVMAWV